MVFVLIVAGISLLYTVISYIRCERMYDFRMKLLRQIRINAPLYEENMAIFYLVSYDEMTRIRNWFRPAHSFWTEDELRFMLGDKYERIINGIR